MLANTFVDNAKVMAKGQVTIPKDIREVLGVESGDRNCKFALLPDAYFLELRLSPHFLK